MINVTILAVGKLKEQYWKDACGEYAKRLKAYCRFSIEEIPEYRLPDSPSPAQIKAGLEKEGETILNHIPGHAYIIALCIEGREIDSLALSEQYTKAVAEGKNTIVFIIGGSFGLADKVKKSANLRLSMSQMTFPHQLARVMLCEQVYRAFSIAANTKYHK